MILKFRGSHISSSVWIGHPLSNRLLSRWLCILVLVNIVVDVHRLIQKALKFLGGVVRLDIVLRVRSLRRKAYRGEAPRCDMDVWL